MKRDEYAWLLDSSDGAQAVLAEPIIPESIRTKRHCRDCCKLEDRKGRVWGHKLTGDYRVCGCRELNEAKEERDMNFGERYAARTRGYT